MKNTTIYFVRHGEVENPESVIYGRLPGFGLSKLGFFQAQKLKDFFSDKKYSIFYASPLLRSKETAKLVANGRTVISDKRLTEIDIKAWEGKPKSSRPNKDISLYINEPEKFIGYGESVLEVLERAKNFIAYIIKRHPGKEIVVITHGELIAAAQVVAGMIDFKEINKAEIRHASITRLELTDGLKCTKAEYKTIAPAQKDMI